jgi:hypothetical protein
MKPAFTLFLAALTWPPMVAAKPSAATPAEMDRAAAEVRTSGGAAGPLSRGLAGRRFQFTLAPRERGPKNEICTGYPSWGWYPAQRLFELSASQDGHDADYFLDAAGRRAIPAKAHMSVQMVAFSCRYTREPKRSVLNMYGETVTHEPTREEVTAIAVARPPAIEKVQMGSYSVTTDEAGARRLGASMAVRISGRIGEWAPGRTIVCGADDYSAFDVPVLVGDFSGCLVNGRVERVEYIDSATGRVRLDVRVKAKGRRAR